MPFIKNDDIKEISTNLEKTKILTEMEKCKVACPTVTFVFDDSNVSSEIQLVNEILTECIPKLQLGLAGDADVAIAQMLSRCYNAGLQKVLDEYKLQYEAWLATR